MLDLLPIQFTSNGTAEDAPVVWAPPSMWWAFSFSLEQHWLSQSLSEWLSSWKISLSLSHFSSLSILSNKNKYPLKNQSNEYSELLCLLRKQDCNLQVPDMLCYTGSQFLRFILNHLWVQTQELVFNLANRAGTTWQNFFWIKHLTRRLGCPFYISQFPGLSPGSNSWFRLMAPPGRLGLWSWLLALMQLRPGLCG